MVEDSAPAFSITSTNDWHSGSTSAKPGVWLFQQMNTDPDWWLVTGQTSQPSLCSQTLSTITDDISDYNKPVLSRSQCYV